MRNMEHNIEMAKQTIRDIIADSGVPEDALHAENVLKWVFILNSSPDYSMILAALAHDIERAYEERKILRRDFDNYDEFKAAHAESSAEILETILDNHHVNHVIISKACSLVRMHETGGTAQSDILSYADSISFFEVNLPYYFQREGYDETLRRCVWGYARLPSELKTICCKFCYLEPTLDMLITRLPLICP